MSELRIKELDAQLLTANETIAQLTKANAELTAGLATAEVQNKKLRRNSRNDSNTLREEISSLQKRRS